MHPASVGPPSLLNTPTSATPGWSVTGRLASGGGGSQAIAGIAVPGSSNAATSISTPNCTFASAK